MPVCECTIWAIQGSANAKRHAIILLMRTTYGSATVRLYHLSDAQEGGAATTLFYGSLDEAMRIAAQQPEDVQDGLFLATDNDVIAYLDLIGD
ncbi:hypothetical protein BV96_00748 [Sphingomonas paucimobilis]|nr:hypothetical protein BV96_00748 [Sphingomonas paucimobilis]